MITTKEVESLFEQNLNVIPVWDDPKHPKWKVAVVKWEQAPKDLIGMLLMMNDFDTNGIAVLLGQRSDGCMCVDVDIKWKPGIGEAVLDRLRKLDFFEKFRVEKTPSGGYHFFYKSLNPTGTKNIGFRETTDKEKAEWLEKNAEKVKNPKAPEKVCFLELKGSGGTCGISPGTGYTVIDGIGDGLDFGGRYIIGTLESEEEEELKSVLYSFNEYFEKPKESKVSKSQAGQYSVNPFEDYTLKDRGSVLEDCGWKYVGKSSEATFWGRPDSNGKECHAAYYKDVAEGLYNIYTTQAGIDSGWYNAGVLFRELNFGGDAKLFFQWLVLKGYGQLKPELETEIVKRAANKGIPIPSNTSEEGKRIYDDEIKKIAEVYPHGQFWEIKDSGEIRIDREKVIRVCTDLGYRVWRESPVIVDGFLIREVEVSSFFNLLKGYIKEEGTEVYDAYEAFIQKSGEWTIKRLKPLEEDKILKSEKGVSYKFYQNCYVRIDSETIETVEYGTFSGLIWEKLQKKRDFSLISPERIGKGIYLDFLTKAIGGNKEKGGVSDYLAKFMGYYAHDYKDEQGYFGLTIEECENAKMGAGSGKSAFWAMFGEITTYLPKAASMVKLDASLLQSWDGEKIVCLADMPKGFDLIFFKELISGQGTLKKLYKNEINLGISDMPKLCGSSNYSYDNSDPGIARRVRTIEFTNYFTLKGDNAIEREYGKRFPDGQGRSGGFDEEDFLCFDNFMLNCIQTFIKSGGVIEKSDLTDSGWNKQFDEKFGHFKEFIDLRIDGWLEIGKVSNHEFGKEYDEYKRENSVRFAMSPQKQNAALIEYCGKLGIEYLHNIGFKDSNHLQTKGRIFRKKKIEESSDRIVGGEPGSDLPF